MTRLGGKTMDYVHGRGATSTSIPHYQCPTNNIEMDTYKPKEDTPKLERSGP